jgi:hypothetical protein
VAGFKRIFRELPDLSHTYPRAANVQFLKWFASKLSEIAKS